MAAVATKKPNGDRGVQLTFPLEFQRAFSMGHSYFPSDYGSTPDIMIGTDFQSQYHQEKRAEANRSVMNGLQARKTAEQKLLTGPHNYHLPKPVLGQRIYANPSYGNVGYSSARQDSGKDAPFRMVEMGQMGAGQMRGGVVSSIEGQRFYQGQLARRIAQLNRMDALAQGYAVEMGQSYRTRDNEKEGSFNKVQFFIYLNALEDAITTGDISRFTFENLKELLGMMFGFAPEATREDFVDILEGIDNALLLARDGLSDDPLIADAPDKEAYAQSLLIYLERMRMYITEMAAKQNLSTPDRVTLSKSLLKSLGFEKLMRVRSVGELVRDVASGSISVGTNIRDRMEDFDGWFGGDDGDDGGGDGWFGHPALPREDEEARGIPRAPLAGRAGDPARERFGHRVGADLYGEAGFFGDFAEDRGRDERIELVMPLGEAGYDDGEGVPPADEETFRQAVEDAVLRVLRPLGFAGTIEDAEEYIAEQYPEPATFVTEVARDLTDQTYTRPQIARGMELLGMPVFADYIAENRGEVAPAPALPARPAGRRGVGGLGGLGALAPAIYRDRDEDGVPDAEGEDAGTGAESTTAAAPAAGVRAPLSAAERRAMAETYNLPVDRADFNERFRSAVALRALGLRIPREIGGPYRMREGTTPRNAKTVLIKLFKKVYDPAF